MKKLHFIYKMKLTFDPPVYRHRFTLKCTPRTDARQEILELEEEIYPKEFLSEDEDSFGNLCVFGYAAGPHDCFSARIEGVARTGLSPAVPAGPEHMVGMYRYQTDSTRPGPSICSFAGTFHFKSGATALDKAYAFMDGLYGRFSYVQGVTGVSTTAEQALALGEGVCQDYSHILLSLCRMERIPCRYVVGMLEGEGLSHAWVEIYHDGGWVALDPTNHCPVGDQHIKISSGRDYRDCLINQGLFTGRSAQRQEISVAVNELQEEKW